MPVTDISPKDINMKNSYNWLIECMYFELIASALATSSWLCFLPISTNVDLLFKSYVIILF
jgi:hypothetical protein